MTKKKLILISGIIVLCLLICLCVAMCSPSEQGGSDTPEPTGTTGSSSMSYTVQVKAAGGTPLEGIGVYIYEDLKMQELVWFAKTDASGMLTFEDIASDNFVAVLADVPAGYLVEEYYPLTGENTEIVLEAGLMEGDLSAITYKLGDLMLDFSVTAPDGTVYTFSELLKEKNAVVLNFWYLQCEPCKSEFPYLQEAYEKYSEDVIVLAMNPVNTDDTEIAQFQKDNGYTFPMAKCDPLWEKAMQLTAYPTTVVIDRYGNICLIHKGSVTDAETFENMFAFYSDEEYEQTIVKDLEEMEEAAGIEQTVGTEDNPVQMGVTPSFQVTVEPGQLMHYEIYRMVTTLYLTVQNENAYIIYNGQTYYPTNGTISIPVATDGTSSALKLVFGNSGSKTETYTVTMASAAGTFGNPYTLKLGDFTAKVPAGTESGINYIYTADKNGLFTIEIDSVTAGVDYKIELNTLTKNGIGSIQRTTESDSVVDETTGKRSVSVYVYKGRTVRVVVGTLPDSSNLYPAATFKLNASLDENAEEGATQKELTAYSINVTDESGNPISGVSLSMMVDGKPVNLTTTEGSAVTRQMPGTYPLVLIVPRGYTAKTTEFKLTEKYPSISIKLDTIEKVTYKVMVLDDSTGKPIEGAEVYFGDVTDEETDVNGCAEVSIPKGTYMVSVLKDGYIIGEVELTAELTTANIALVAGTNENARAYTVKVTDYFGNLLPNVKIVFKQNGAVKGSATTNASGVAVKTLAMGVYTLGTDGYYVYQNATLTEENTTGTIVVVKNVGTETDNYVGKQVPCVYEGATYLSGLQGTTTAGITTYDYLLFQPTGDFIYKFTLLGTNAKISYWGSNTSFMNDKPSDLSTVTDPSAENYTGNFYDSDNNCFGVDAGIEINKPPCIIGITGGSDCVLIIEPIGSSLQLPTVTELYENTHTPSSTGYSIPSGTRTSLDLSKSITLTKESDGYYYNGNLVYVELGPGAPKVSFSEMLGITFTSGGTGFYDLYLNSAGDGYIKEDYDAAMKEYINAALANNDAGLYPLTEDLAYMIQAGGAYKQWYTEGVNCLFEESENVILANGWLFAMCYFR